MVEKVNLFKLNFNRNKCINYNKDIMWTIV